MFAMGNVIVMRGAHGMVTQYNPHLFPGMFGECLAFTIMLPAEANFSELLVTY